MWKILLLTNVLLITCSRFVHGDSMVPCFFIFGDSLFDAGNNNDLITNATANYAPYGVDFENKLATGRFTNGLTISDFLTQRLGFKQLIPPFGNASRNDTLKGLNYASGGAGILSKSGTHLGDRIWLARQMENHGRKIAKLKSIIDGPVSEYLNKCLYTINIGSNDYINNYFMPQIYDTQNVSSPDEFATTLVTQYEQQVKVLYDYGARKTALFGLGPVGCAPAIMRRNDAKICVHEINEAVGLFNKKLKQLVNSLNVKFPSAKFTYIDAYAIQSFAPLTLGLLTDASCCKLRSDFQCEASVKPCPNRDLYAFMDGFHSTQIINKLNAKLAFSSPPLLSFVHPMNIKDLVTSTRRDLSNNNGNYLSTM